MNFKKKCINFKKNAKEFGYELKLTHVQELLAKYEGFSNRHALLNSQNDINKNEDKKEYFYEIHVFYGMDDGYSVAYRSLTPFQKYGGVIDEEAVIEKIKQINLLADEDDYSKIDRIEEIDRKEWEYFTDYNEKQIECYNCNQLWDDDSIQNTEPQRKEVICKKCYSNEIKMFISTDDGYFDFVETYINDEYMKWAIDNDREFIDMLLDGFYGPDSHTDVLLYNSDTPTAKSINNYVETINSVRDTSLGDELVGFSVTVDEDSFLKWKENNKWLLSQKGFDV